MVEGFKIYMMSLMEDKKSGFIAAIFKFILLVLSWIYLAGIRTVDLAYRLGIRRRYEVPVPVISVGNITLGGTGKTPFVVFLAEHMKTRGKSPAVLIRGYGGDESRMLKERLRDIPVFVGQDRVRSALSAANTGSDVIILDDGFQHRRLARALDIVLVSGSSVFGSGHLFPRGVLREPVAGLERASLVVVTKSDRITDKEKAGIVLKLEKTAPGKPVVFTKYQPDLFTDAAGGVYRKDHVRGKKICLVSGIADPDYLAFQLEGLGAAIEARFDHTDHHRYTQKDIARIYGSLSASGAELVITTHKDYVKIRELDISPIVEKIFILSVAVDVTGGREDLIAGLNSVCPGQGA